MKLKKRKKVGKYRGSSTHGWGARKKHISSGNRGGKGMAGTGKTAGHRYSFLTKFYPDGYLGKQGETSRSTRRRDNKVMNLDYIQQNLEMLKKKYADKNNVLVLDGYKILGDGELKEKINIKALSASKSAKEKIEKAGGIITIKVYEEKKGNVKKVEEKR